MNANISLSLMQDKLKAVISPASHDVVFGDIPETFIIKTNDGNLFLHMSIDQMHDLKDQLVKLCEENQDRHLRAV